MHLDDATMLLGSQPVVDVEATSVLQQAEPLVLHVAEPPSPATTAEVAGVLEGLPTVTVVVGDPARVPEDLVGAADVCLTDSLDPPSPWVRASVDLIERSVADRPLPALALVALLRRSGAGTVWDRLAAEAASYGLLLGSADFRAWLGTRATRPDAIEEADPLRVHRVGDVLELELDRPGVHNALSTRLRDELVAALALPLADPAITTVRLRGRGPSFCAGGDLEEFGTVGDPATSFAVRLSRHPGRAVHRVADRTSVHVHGACIGAGIEVAAFASEVVAAPDAVFRLPELAMGLIPGAGGTVSLPARIGRHRTAWLALTGQGLPADEALEWGLVDRLVS